MAQGRPLQTVVDAVVDALVIELQPSKVILFGSAARRDSGPDSDLDLMVILPEVSDEHSEATRAYAALRSVKHRPPVDVLVFSAKDVEEWGDVVGHVINDALMEGRVVYDAA